MQLVADMERVPQYTAEGERNRLKIVCVLWIGIEREMQRLSPKHKWELPLGGWIFDNFYLLFIIISTAEVF